MTAEQVQAGPAGPLRHRPGCGPGPMYTPEPLPRSLTRSCPGFLQIIASWLKFSPGLVRCRWGQRWGWCLQKHWTPWKRTGRWCFERGALPAVRLSNSLFASVVAANIALGRSHELWKELSDVLQDPGSLAPAALAGFVSWSLDCESDPGPRRLVGPRLCQRFRQTVPGTGLRGFGRSPGTGATPWSWRKSGPLWHWGRTRKP